MKNQEQRDWSEVPEHDLDYIIRHDPHKNIVRAAKAEKKRRNPIEFNPVPTNSTQAGTVSRVEIVRINLSFKDWVFTMFKAYLALVLVVLFLSIPMLILYMLFGLLILGSLF